MFKGRNVDPQFAVLLQDVRIEGIVFSDDDVLIGLGLRKSTKQKEEEEGEFHTSHKKPLTVGRFEKGN